MGNRLEGFEVFGLCFLVHFSLIFILSRILSVSVNNHSNKWWFKTLLWVYILIFPYILRKK